MKKNRLNKYLADLPDDDEWFGRPTIGQCIFEAIATLTMFLGMLTMLLMCISMMG